jgi:Tol biopolymer transport system component
MELTCATLASVRRPLRWLSCILLVGVAASPAAGGTFPGRNGRIVFESNLVAGDCSMCEWFGPYKYTLWSIRSDGRSLRRLGLGTGPDFSPNGRRLAYSQYTFTDEQQDHTKGIYVRGLDGSSRRPLTSGEDFGPVWAPRGDMLAFSGASGLSVVRADGGGLQVLGRGATPSWSPSGGVIAFEARGHVFTLRRDGTGLTDLGLGRRPSWSPRGRLAFLRRGEIHVRVPGRPGTQRLARGRISGFEWSPSGRLLAFARHGDIHVIGERGAGRRRVTFGRGGDCCPVWSPDGRKLTLIRDEYGDESLRVVSLRGGPSQRLVQRRCDPDNRCAELRASAWQSVGR